MAAKNSDHTSAAERRQRAESQAARSPAEDEALSPAAARLTLHELRVHQIELEMQNEELRRAQAELDAARRRYFDLYDLAPAGYCTLSEPGLILEANLTAATLLDVARGALVGEPLSRFIHKEDADSFYLCHKRLFKTGQPQTCELRMGNKDGEMLWAHLAANAAQDADGSTVCRLALSDITERKQVEVDLLRSAADLHALAARLQDVREQERASLSRELHDNLGQHLTAFALQFESVCMESRALADGSSALALLCDKITGMTPLVERLIEQTQSICAMLRPGVLDELGLVAALEWLAEKTEKRTGLIITTSLPAEDIELDRDIALALFRIAQEALANVARHARAARAEIRLRASGGMWELEIQDNGQGFTPSSRVGPMALGLLGMRERAGAFGGTVDFLSETGKGATVRVRVPSGARSAMKGERV